MTREIDFPEGFIQFTWLFLPNLTEEYGNFDDAVPHIVEKLTPHDRAELKGFLEFLLEQDLPDKTLEDVWNYPGPIWKISIGGHRSFFKQVLEVIVKNHPDT